MRRPSLVPGPWSLVPLLLLACSSGPKADLVVFGKIWTGDPSLPYAQALAVSHDTIMAVGDSAAIARLAGSRTERIANPAGLVVPGFWDDHVHFLQGGAHVAGVQLRDAATPAEFIRRLKEFAAGVQPGEWITGGDWDHELWPGAPLPDRAWIDSVTPQNPVAVNRLDGHMILANSLALKAAAISRSTRDVPGGTIVRRPNGEPTGVLKDQAAGPVLGAVPSLGVEQRDSLLARTMAFAVSKGVTGIANVAVPWEEVDAFNRAHARGTLLIRSSQYPALVDWRRVAAAVKVNGAGDLWLRVAGVKGFVDGSLGSTTALFFRPFTDAPRTSGLLVTPEDSLRRWIGEADSAGLQVVVHAIGDRANALLLDIFDSVARAHGARDRRFRIEHAQHLRPEDIPRFARLGVLASMQPYHTADDGRWAEKRIGRERIRTTYAFRSLLDAKAHLLFGSDWFVAPPDPLLGIKAAVTRQTIDGKHPEGWVPEQKITVEEALRSYTVENAYGVFAEQALGKLAPGYQADLVLLDRDITRVPPASIDQAQVLRTIVAGKTVYRKP